MAWSAKSLLAPPCGQVLRHASRGAMLVAALAAVLAVIEHVPVPEPSEDSTEPIALLQAFQRVSARSPSPDGAAVPAAVRRNSTMLSEVQAHQDLVLMHVPYNFGHTVEAVALFPTETNAKDASEIVERVLGGYDGHKPVSPVAAAGLKASKRADGVAWGHFDVELHQISDITGCPLYYTPQKYWPQDIAQQYFGDKTVFGLLRHPAERLIAMFRGAQQLLSSGDDYGGDGFPQEDLLTCNANHGIKSLLLNLTSASSNPFMGDCSYIPQAEYFEGPHGITLVVDNMEFPCSMNKVFSEHGYNCHIYPDDIEHVSGCPQVWSADLDIETKALIKKFFKADYDLMCQHFGYCDPDADMCLHGVYRMCPDVACTAAKRCCDSDSECPGVSQYC